MKDSIKNEILVGVSVAFGFFGLVGIGSAIYSGHKAAVCAEMIGAAADKVSGMTQVDVDKGLLDKLVQNSVKEQTDRAAQIAVNKVTHDLNADLRNQVRQAVKNHTESINKRVADQLAKELSDVDRDEIMSSVIDATTEKLVEKLGDDLDKEVGKLGKIYKGIAAVMQ